MTYENSSIQIAKHENESVASDVKNVILSLLPNDESTLINFDLSKYRAKILEIQNELNSMDFARKIVKAIFPSLSSYLNTQSILIQSNIYLRASRPIKPLGQENIGWHRETFYGSNMEKAVNIWTPIKGVDEKNTLQFVPESHLIPEEDIVFEKSKDNFTDQFSNGHKLGFQYEPKTIVSGVNFETKKRLIVPFGSSAIFDGNLIHGAAQNKSKNIRFSVDLRVLRKSDFKENENKKFHYSSGKPYFEEF